MDRVYAATHISKEVSHWHPTEGASLERWSTMGKPINVEAETFGELLEKLRKRYFVKLDDLFLPENEEDGIEWFSFDQVETNDGDEPTEDDLREWEAGHLKLYLCDYSFSVVYREARPVRLEEIKASGVTTH